MALSCERDTPAPDQDGLALICQALNATYNLGDLAALVAPCMYQAYAKAFGVPKPQLVQLYLRTTSGRTVLQNALTALAEPPAPAMPEAEPAPVSGPECEGEPLFFFEPVPEDTAKVVPPAAEIPPAAEAVRDDVRRVRSVPVPPGYREFTGPPERNWRLDPVTQDELRTQLLNAVKSGRNADMEEALQTVVRKCRTAGQDYFVTQFCNWTAVSALIIGVSRRLGLRFGFYWTEDGLGEEILVKPLSPLSAGRKARLQQSQQASAPSPDKVTVARELPPPPRGREWIAPED